MKEFENFQKKNLKKKDLTLEIKNIRIYHSWSNLLNFDKGGLFYVMLLNNWCVIVFSLRASHEKLLIAFVSIEFLFFVFNKIETAMVIFFKWNLLLIIIRWCRVVR